MLFRTKSTVQFPYLEACGMRKWGTTKEKGGAGIRLVPVLWRNVSEKYQSQIHRPLEHLEVPVACHVSDKCFLRREQSLSYTGHTQKNGAVLIVNTNKNAPFFCVCLYIPARLMLAPSSQHSLNTFQVSSYQH
jgi:hypothetical protein